MSDDWTDVLGALAESGARFLVIGAYAMAVHGVPRGTQDLDDLEALGELPPP